MDKAREKRKRKEKNDEILRKLKAGESLSLSQVRDSWFPPRPKIKKDTEAMRKLYKGDSDETDPDQEEPHN